MNIRLNCQYPGFPSSPASSPLYIITLPSFWKEIISASGAMYPPRRELISVPLIMVYIVYMFFSIVVRIRHRGTLRTHFALYSARGVFSIGPHCALWQSIHAMCASSWTTWRDAECILNSEATLPRLFPAPECNLYCKAVFSRVFPALESLLHLQAR